MGKNYVILNCADYQSSQDGVRSNAVKYLGGAFERRVQKKGGTFHIHHVADLLAELRRARHSKQPPRDVEGVLDEGWIGRLMAEAALYRTNAWSAIQNSCRDADKIIFAAHGKPGDTDNVYCDVGLQSVRLGTVRGVIRFLNYLLNDVKRKDPTVMLSVCFSARSADKTKDHVKSDLTEGDLRSSIAFKVFQGLSKTHPGIRVTGRTGAMSADETGTTVTSTTEEAIMAQETIKSEFADPDKLIGEAMQAQAEFEKSLKKSNLTPKEQEAIIARLDAWFIHGFDAKQLGSTLETIDKLDQVHKSKIAVFFSKIGLAMNQPWSKTFETEVNTLKKISPLKDRLAQLKKITEQKKSKYGKFVYQRDSNHIIVSRWVDDQVVQVARLNG